MKTQIMIFAFMALAAISCNPTKNSKMNQSNVSITETYWKLSKLEGKEITNAPHQTQEIHFILKEEGKRISGFTGCNIFNGTFILEPGNRIRFSPLGTTRMACPDITVNESAFLEVFELADNYTISGDSLMLNVGKRAPLAIFTKTSVPEEVITEKYWKLKTLEGQEVKMVKNQEREIYFMLKTNENKVVGFAGCNTFNGTYSLDKGNRIRFSQMATTMMACPDVDVNEHEFLKIFELADNYTIQNDVLSLNVGRRAPLAVFEAVYFK